MEVIAKTAGGLLINATESEVKEIINSVSGIRPEKIEIGQKIPAIDYAATITKIKSLKTNYDYQQLLAKGADLQKSIDNISKAVNSAADITV